MHEDSNNWVCDQIQPTTEEESTVTTNEWIRHLDDYLESLFR